MIDNENFYFLKTFLYLCCYIILFLLQKAVSFNSYWSEDSYSSVTKSC